MEKQQFTFHTDPGHGWIEVPTDLARELDIFGKISTYSYESRDRRTLFLEEDYDATLFVDAMKEKGRELEFIDKYDENTFIRGLPHFNRCIGGTWLTCGPVRKL